MQTFYNFKSAYYVIFPDHWFIDKTWEIDLKQTVNQCFKHHSKTSDSELSI